MAKEQSTQFVKIQNPRIARKIILENTRDIIRVLQGYEQFKSVREQRTKLISVFRNDMNEIRSLVIELRSMLPKANIKEIRRPIIVQQQMAQKPVRELKKLEQELADIESKLNGI